MRESTLMAQAFDMRSLSTTGDPVPIAENVQTLGGPPNGVFSTSLNGTLVYQSATPGSGATLTWFDRKGKLLGTLGEPAIYDHLEISPDGTRAAVTIRPASGTRDIWIVDLARGGVRTRVTSDPANKMAPVWSPDGTTLGFDSDRKAGPRLYTKPASGVGSEEALPLGDVNQRTFSWVGQWLLYQQASGAGRVDLWVVAPKGDRKPVPFLQSQFAKVRAKFSPDGRWVSYETNESGSRAEVYVAPFPKADAKYLVSTAGGGAARWRRDGKEIFYLDPSSVLMAVDVNGDGPTLKIGTPKPLFMISSGANSFAYDVSPDGQRVLVVAGRAEALQPLTVVTNWTAGLKK